MHIYICIYVFVYIYTYIYIHFYTYIHIYTYICIDESWPSILLRQPIIHTTHTMCEKNPPSRHKHE